MKLNSPKFKNTVFRISALLVLFAAIFHSFEPAAAKYVMIAGAVGFLTIVFTLPYNESSLRMKRLFNIQVMAALLIIVSAYLMFVDIRGWVVTLLISALLMLYSTVMLSRANGEDEK